MLSNEKPTAVIVDLHFPHEGVRVVANRSIRQQT